jgi:hypothetical protein
MRVELCAYLLDSSSNCKLKLGALTNIGGSMYLVYIMGHAFMSRQFFR